MEIKVIYSSDPYKGKETLIVEGENINHRLIYFEDKDNFLYQFGLLPKSENEFIVGIPEYFWTHETPKDNIKKCFVLISFIDNKGNYSIIIAMNCTVFITNHGQTVDKIEISN